MTTFWSNPATLEELNNMGKSTLGALLGIHFTEINERELVATMPVDERTHQPYGLLHGGASAALAETIGSVASFMCINPQTQICVGVEINCNHIRGKRDGQVTARCSPLHTGATLHVWDIRIVDEQQRLICISRLTVSVLKRKDQA